MLEYMIIIKVILIMKKNVSNKSVKELSKEAANKKLLFESVYNTVLERVNFNLDKTQVENNSKALFVEQVFDAVECAPPKMEEINEEIVEKREEVQEQPSVKVNKVDQAKELQIKNKLIEYNKKLVREFLLPVLTEEKLKEEEREQLFQKTKDAVERKRLEKILAFERAQSSDRINKVNETIEVKMKEFEDSLRNPKKK
jgi:hypothetical protein